MNNPDYIIVTPAYNEERYIGATIDSVLVQTIVPKLWIIVDDGSSDATAAIIRDKTAHLPWVRYIYRPKRPGQTYYASNVHAIEEGLLTAKDLSYRFLAILDADISLPADYYARIFGLFRKDPRLGIASGIYLTRTANGLESSFHDRRSCPKNIMVFNPQCFREIGGFLPLKYGGEDTCACFMARMRGWKVRSFPEIEVAHNKPPGTGHASSSVKISFKQGIEEYFLATHPVFMLLKSARRCVQERPFIRSGAARLYGYVYAHFMGEKRQIERDLVRFIQREQVSRIFGLNRVSEEA